METLLAADIGGTKSDLAVFRLLANDYSVITQRQYINSEYSSAEEIIEHFLQETGQLPQLACFAVAGIIAGNRARMTNLPWQLDSGLLEKRYGIERVMLINDLTALCSSLGLLLPEDLLEIQQGSKQGGEVSGVVAPGTGLGEGFRVATGGRMFVCGSEGGHTDFAPVDEEQAALLAWMQKRMQPVSYEALISGSGLAKIYDFCREYHQIPESAWIATQMNNKKDRSPVIVGSVTGRLGPSPCPLCSLAVDLFLSILGSEAGNLALKLYARGGIYLGGGILPRLAGSVNFDGFLKAFRKKGMMSALMLEIPVSLILKKDAALAGAACFARQSGQYWSSDGR